MLPTGFYRPIKMSLGNLKFSQNFENHFTLQFDDIPSKTTEINPVLQEGPRIYDIVKSKQKTSITKTFMDSRNDVFIKNSLLNGNTYLKCADGVGYIYETNVKFIMKEIEHEGTQYVVKKTENCNLKVCIKQLRKYFMAYHFIEAFNCSKIANIK